MLGQLIALSKNGEEKEKLPVINLHFFIGSDLFCDLRIKHREIAAQHCLITSQNDKPALIRNLSRSIPTLVNNTEIGINDVELKDQDIIAIRHKNFKWCYKSFTEPSTSTSTDFGATSKNRKSWPLFKNKLVAVVTPQRRDEPKEVAPKKRRATIAVESKSTKKPSIPKVLAVKSGLKATLKRSFGKKRSSVKAALSTTNVGRTPQPTSNRKSVKFVDTTSGPRSRLGKRGRKNSLSTPYQRTPARQKTSVLLQTSSVPLKSRLGQRKTISPNFAASNVTRTSPNSRSAEKRAVEFSLSSSSNRCSLLRPKVSLYATPPSTFKHNVKLKSILKTPSSSSSSSCPSKTKRNQKSTIPVVVILPATPEVSGTSIPEVVENDILRTPPKREQPEIVMRSSRRKAAVVISPPSTPKSAVKRKKSPEEKSIEASERAAKKLKRDPPYAIDKKKKAALLQCHRKSLTPHPDTKRNGKLITRFPSSFSSRLTASPISVRPLSKTTRPRKSEPLKLSTDVPKVFRFGSLGSGVLPISQVSFATQEISKPEKNQKKVNQSLYKSSSKISTSPVIRKLTRASKAAEASRQQQLRADIDDVLSALDLSRKWPPASPRTVNSDSLQIDVSNFSGFKKLFCTDKTLDARELFLESSSKPNNHANESLQIFQESPENSFVQSATPQIGGKEESGSLNSFNSEGAQEVPCSESLLSGSLLVPNYSSTSRRSLSLKGVRKTALSPNDVNHLIHAAQKNKEEQSFENTLEIISKPGTRQGRRSCSLVNTSFNGNNNQFPTPLNSNCSLSQKDFTGSPTDTSTTFSLGSFSSSRQRSRSNDSLSLLQVSDNNENGRHITFGSILKSKSKLNASSVRATPVANKSHTKGRVSLRRAVLLASTPKPEKNLHEISTLSIEEEVGSLENSSSEGVSFDNKHLPGQGPLLKLSPRITRSQNSSLNPGTKKLSIAQRIKQNMLQSTSLPVTGFHSSVKRNLDLLPTSFSSKRVIRHKRKGWRGSRLNTQPENSILPKLLMDKNEDVLIKSPLVDKLLENNYRQINDTSKKGNSSSKRSTLVQKSKSTSDIRHTRTEIFTTLNTTDPKLQAVTNPFNSVSKIRQRSIESTGGNATLAETSAIVSRYSLRNSSIVDTSKLESIPTSIIKSVQKRGRPTKAIISDSTQMSPLPSLVKKRSRSLPSITVEKIPECKIIEEVTQNTRTESGLSADTNKLSYSSPLIEISTPAQALVDSGKIRGNSKESIIHEGKLESSTSAVKTRSQSNLSTNKVTSSNERRKARVSRASKTKGLSPKTDNTPNKHKSVASVSVNNKQIGNHVGSDIELNISNLSEKIHSLSGLDVSPYSVNSVLAKENHSKQDISNVIVPITNKKTSRSFNTTSITDKTQLNGSFSSLNKTSLKHEEIAEPVTSSVKRHSRSMPSMNLELNITNHQISPQSSPKRSSMRVNDCIAVNSSSSWKSLKDDHNTPEHVEALPKDMMKLRKSSRLSNGISSNEETQLKEMTYFPKRNSSNKSLTRADKNISVQTVSLPIFQNNIRKNRNKSKDSTIVAETLLNSSSHDNISFEVGMGIITGSEAKQKCSQSPVKNRSRSVSSSAIEQVTPNNDSFISLAPISARRRCKPHNVTFNDLQMDSSSSSVVVNETPKHTGKLIINKSTGKRGRPSKVIDNEEIKVESPSIIKTRSHSLPSVNKAIMTPKQDISLRIISKGRARSLRGNILVDQLKLSSTMVSTNDHDVSPEPLNSKISGRKSRLYKASLINDKTLEESVSLSVGRRSHSLPEEMTSKQEANLKIISKKARQSETCISINEAPIDTSCLLLTRLDDASESANHLESLPGNSGTVRRRGRSSKVNVNNKKLNLEVSPIKKRSHSLPASKYKLMNPKMNVTVDFGFKSLRARGRQSTVSFATNEHFGLSPEHDLSVSYYGKQLRRSKDQNEEQSPSSKDYATPKNNVKLEVDSKSTEESVRKSKNRTNGESIEKDLQLSKASGLNHNTPLKQSNKNLEGCRFTRTSELKNNSFASQMDLSNGKMNSSYESVNNSFYSAASATDASNIPQVTRKSFSGSDLKNQYSVLITSVDNLVLIPPKYPTPCKVRSLEKSNTSIPNSQTKKGSRSNNTTSSVIDKSFRQLVSFSPFIDSSESNKREGRSPIREHELVDEKSTQITRVSTRSKGKHSSDRNKTSEEKEGYKINDSSFLSASKIRKPKEIKIDEVLACAAHIDTADSSLKGKRSSDSQTFGTDQSTQTLSPIVNKINPRKRKLVKETSSTSIKVEKNKSFGCFVHDNSSTSLSPIKKKLRSEEDSATLNSSNKLTYNNRFTETHSSTPIVTQTSSVFFSSGMQNLRRFKKSGMRSPLGISLTIGSDESVSSVDDHSHVSMICLPSSKSASDIDVGNEINSKDSESSFKFTLSNVSLTKLNNLTPVVANRVNTRKTRLSGVDKSIELVQTVSALGNLDSVEPSGICSTDSKTFISKDKMNVLSKNSSLKSMISVFCDKSDNKESTKLSLQENRSLRSSNVDLVTSPRLSTNKFKHKSYKKSSLRSPLCNELPHINEPVDIKKEGMKDLSLRLSDTVADMSYTNVKQRNRRGSPFSVNVSPVTKQPSPAKSRKDTIAEETELPHETKLKSVVDPIIDHKVNFPVVNSPLLLGKRKSKKEVIHTERETHSDTRKMNHKNVIEVSQNSISLKSPVKLRKRKPIKLDLNTDIASIENELNGSDGIVTRLRNVKRIDNLSTNDLKKKKVETKIVTKGTAIDSDKAPKVENVSKMVSRNVGKGRRGKIIAESKQEINEKSVKKEKEDTMDLLFKISQPLRRGRGAIQLEEGVVNTETQTTKNKTSPHLVRRGRSAKENTDNQKNNYSLQNVILATKRKPIKTEDLNVDESSKQHFVEKTLQVEDEPNRQIVKSGRGRKANPTTEDKARSPSVPVSKTRTKGAVVVLKTPKKIKHVLSSPIIKSPFKRARVNSEKSANTSLISRRKGRPRKDATASSNSEIVLDSLQSLSLEKKKGKKRVNVNSNINDSELSKIDKYRDDVSRHGTGTAKPKSPLRKGRSASKIKHGTEDSILEEKSRIQLGLSQRRGRAGISNHVGDSDDQKIQDLTDQQNKPKTSENTRKRNNKKKEEAVPVASPPSLRRGRSAVRKDVSPSPKRRGKQLTTEPKEDLENQNNLTSSTLRRRGGRPAVREESTVSEVISKKVKKLTLNKEHDSQHQKSSATSPSIPKRGRSTTKNSDAPISPKKVERPLEDLTVKKKEAVRRQGRSTGINQVFTKIQKSETVVIDLKKSPKIDPDKSSQRENKKKAEKKKDPSPNKHFSPIKKRAKNIKHSPSDSKKDISKTRGKSGKKQLPPEVFEKIHKVAEQSKVLKNRKVEDKKPLKSAMKKILRISLSENKVKRLSRKSSITGLVKIGKKTVKFNPDDHFRFVSPERSIIFSKKRTSVNNKQKVNKSKRGNKKR